MAEDQKWETLIFYARLGTETWKPEPKRFLGQTNAKFNGVFVLSNFWRNNEMSTFFSERGYPDSILSKALNRVQNVNRESALETISLRQWRANSFHAHFPS